MASTKSMRSAILISVLLIVVLISFKSYRKYNYVVRSHEDSMSLTRKIISDFNKKMNDLDARNPQLIDSIWKQLGTNLIEVKDLDQKYFGGQLGVSGSQSFKSIDGYGRPLLFRFQKQADSTNPFYGCVWSVGKNGSNEWGNGDDVEIR